MENVFQEVRSDKIKVDSSMIDLLFKCLDAIDSYVANIKSTSDEGTDDTEAVSYTHLADSGAYCIICVHSSVFWR